MCIRDRTPADESAQDDHGPHYLRQSGADCIKSQTARLDHRVVGAQGFAVQQLLSFSGWFELRQRYLKPSHEFERTAGNFSLSLQGPRFIDDVPGVVAQSLLKVRSDRFGVTGHVAVKRIQCGGLTRYN